VLVSPFAGGSLSGVHYQGLVGSLLRFFACESVFSLLRFSPVVLGNSRIPFGLKFTVQVLFFREGPNWLKLWAQRWHLAFCRVFVLRSASVLRGLGIIEALTPSCSGSQEVPIVLLLEGWYYSPWPLSFQEIFLWHKFSPFLTWLCRLTPAFSRRYEGFSRFNPVESFYVQIYRSLASPPDQFLAVWRIPTLI